MAELKEKKFGYVVQPPFPPPPPPPKPYPFPPPPRPLPPGMTVADWTAYINSYIDVRARQLYDKLKGLVTKAGVQEVTYEEADIGSDTKKIGTLKVDRNETPVKIPTIEIRAANESSFGNPTGPIVTFKGIGENGEDLNVYCENPIGAILPYVRLKDKETDQIYSLYMENGELKSSEIRPVTD